MCQCSGHTPGVETGGGGADIGRCTVWRAPSVSPSFTDACSVVDDPPAVALKKKGCFVLFL